MQQHSGSSEPRQGGLPGSLETSSRGNGLGAKKHGCLGTRVRIGGTIICSVGFTGKEEEPISLSRGLRARSRVRNLSFRSPIPQIVCVESMQKDSQGFSTAFTFKKFRDLLNLISLNVHFIQRCAKVTKKPVEMAFV